MQRQAFPWLRVISNYSRLLARLKSILNPLLVDQTFFWTSIVLENQLRDYRRYYNEHRCHASRKGASQLIQAMKILLLSTTSDGKNVVADRFSCRLQLEALIRQGHAETNTGQYYPLQSFELPVT